MSARDGLLLAWWRENLETLAREIAELAAVCRVRILDDAVRRRVLDRDASVCATSNPLAFAKLHDLLVLHESIRGKTADVLGQARTDLIERDIAARLEKSS